MPGAKIKGVMKLEGEIKGVERHTRIKDLLFDLVSKLKCIVQAPESQLTSVTTQVKNEKKRAQPSYSLINPHRKVRKVEGVAYGNLNLDPDASD